VTVGTLLGPEGAGNRFFIGPILHRTAGSRQTTGAAVNTGPDTPVP